MPATLAAESRIGHRLDTRSTDRLLAQAGREASRIVVDGSVDGRHDEWTGVIVGCHGPFLSVRPDRPDPPLGTLPTLSTLRVRLEINGFGYAFETRPLYAAEGPGPGVIHLERPRTVILRERRRSPRRRLHRPTDVILAPAGGTTDWHCQAAMLNVSPEGLACRVPNDQIESMVVGGTLRVSFRLERSDAEFNLAARVSNVTEGGTPGYVVVGLEFTRTGLDTGDRGEADRNRLRALLELGTEPADRRSDS
jgi:hypothetical protein